MDRSNHYEAAFEGYLRDQGICYVAVDERRRALLDHVPLKSLDFVVYGDAGARLVVDIKGRRFPGGPPGKPKRVWECWCEREDVGALESWSGLFGTDYQGLLVFTYHLHPTIELPDDTEDLFCFRGRRYLFRAVEIRAYRDRMRVRSPRWDTVDLSCEDYRAIVQPLSYYTRGRHVAAETEECPF
jgi:hypothetical protein